LINVLNNLGTENDENKKEFLTHFIKIKTNNNKVMEI
jgi:hypothetical protein